MGAKLIKPKPQPEQHLAHQGLSYNKEHKPGGLLE